MRLLLLFLLLGIQFGHSQSLDLNNVYSFVENEYTIKYMYENTKVRVTSSGYSSNKKEELKVESHF